MTRYIIDTISKDCRILSTYELIAEDAREAWEKFQENPPQHMSEAGYHMTTAEERAAARLFLYDTGEGWSEPIEEDRLEGFFLLFCEESFEEEFEDWLADMKRGGIIKEYKEVKTC